MDALLDLLGFAPGLLIAAFLGALVQRVTGMGFGLALSGFALATFDPFTAVYVSALIGFGVTCTTTIQTYRHAVWTSIRPLVLPLMGAMVLGFFLVYWVGHLPLVRALFQAQGLLAFGVALHGLLSPPKPQHSPLMSRVWISGSLTGFLSGTIGVPGPTIAVYFLSKNIVGLAFVASITPVFILTSATRTVIGSTIGVENQTFYVALLGAALAILGVFTGAAVAQFVSVRWQRRLLISLITISTLRLALALLNGLWIYFSG